MNKEVQAQIKGMGRSELVELIEDDDIEIDPKGKLLAALRKLVIKHFNNTSKAKLKQPKNKPFATVTDKQLVKLSSMLGYKKAIVDEEFGWQIKSIQVAACIPSTHEEMLVNADRLVQILNPSLERTNIPRLHYAKKNGGIDSRYDNGKGAYPGRFAKRTGLSGMSLKCVEHGIQYSECNADCRIGIHTGTMWMFETLTKRSKKVSKPKRQEPASDMSNRLAKIMEG